MLAHSGIPDPMNRRPSPLESPAKRHRSNSSPTLAHLSLSNTPTPFLLTESATYPFPSQIQVSGLAPLLPDPANTCRLKSILSVSVSPASTPSPHLASLPLSRCSSQSSKSVRFARCTNASVFPAYSREDYDRSPIVIDEEGKALDIRREKEENECWIKCIAHARAKAFRAYFEEPKTKKLPQSPSVEGVHGLVNGGYFVGDELSKYMGDSGDELEETEAEADGHEPDTAEIFDDEEEGDSSSSETTAPALIQDDPEHDNISDSSVEGGVDVYQTISSPTPSESSERSLHGTSKSPTRRRRRPRLDSGESGSESGVSAGSSDEEASKKERYGICGLGKFSRMDVFQSYDSLGGF